MFKIDNSLNSIKEYKDGKKETKAIDTSYLARGIEEGTLEYYKAIMPKIYNRDEDYMIFVDHYNKFYEEHPELKPKKVNEIDLLMTKMKLGHEVKINETKEEINEEEEN